jgi:alpha-tubulin suppressor-like RCC1 family protein
MAGLAAAGPGVAPVPAGAGAAEPRWAALSAGALHTCGLTDAGAAHCWGADTDGRLGNGAALTDAQGTPTSVESPAGVVWASISSGFDRTCAVSTEGAGWCWGSDASGKLGNGPDLVDAQASPSPVATPPGVAWASISTGSAGTFTCGVTTAGAGLCWGSDGGGKLGNGPAVTADQPAPHPVAAPDGVTWAAIEGGTNHACGLTTAGAALCWGNDSSGQLGNGDGVTSTEAPGPVLLPDGVVLASLSAGSTQTCGVATTGAAYCWGSDGNGRLGNGPDLTGNQHLPTLVVAPPGATLASVTTAGTHTCGTTTAGAALCWGGDTNGRLGNGPDPATDQVAPSPVTADGTTWAAVTAGNAHTCGLTTTGAARCWGHGGSGRLGGGLDQPAQDVPAAVGAIPARAAQAITFAALPDRRTDAAPFAVEATASSGLPVALAAEGACTIAGATVTVTGSGTCTVTATQPGDATWAAATPVARPFAVTTPVPSLALTGAPRPLVGTTTATIAFTVAPATGLDVHCRLDDGDWAVCTSPATFSDLDDGAHTASVRARHPGGDWVTATATWTVLTDLPEVDPRLASLTSRWLASRLSEEGAYQNPLGGVLPDHGLTIDALIAMYASHDGELADPIVTFLDDEEHAGDYFTWGGLVPDDPDFEEIIVAGATAKTLVAALVSGRDPHAFGGWDLVEETLGTIVTTDVEPRGLVAGHQGRIRDHSKLPAYEDHVSNSANLFGQSLAVIGLAGAGVPFGPEDPAGMAVAALVRQQCAEGYVRIFFSQRPYSDPEHPTVTSRTQTCDEGKATGTSPPDGDATGLALSALLAAREAGATGLDGPIARAVDWLERNQDAGGGWGGGVGTEAPNSNSTGLIVQALADAGAEPAVVARGAEYLEGLLIGDADLGVGGLDGLVGAVAYDRTGYDATLASGTVTNEDTWIRASAQAALGLARVGFGDLVRGTVPNPDPRSASESWVWAAHEDFLDRAPTPGEEAAAVARLDAGTPRSTLARELATSDEWLSVIVTRFYTDTLGRSPGADEVAYWTGELRSGRRTVATVAASFYGSAEYLDGRDAAWIADLYDALLGRAATPADVTYWSPQATARGRGWVALQLFRSQESRRARVEGLYRDLLGRAADAGGRDYWAGRLTGEGDIALARHLASSAEYLTRARTRFP